MQNTHGINIVDGARRMHLKKVVSQTNKIKHMKTSTWLRSLHSNSELSSHAYINPFRPEGRITPNIKEKWQREIQVAEAVSGL